MIHRSHRRLIAGSPVLPVWVVPFAYSAGAFALGVIIPRIEARDLFHLRSSIATASAMAIYSSIATGMITITGIVFSLVFLTVQFSASAYSPRLVLWISRDPIFYHAIGIFTATFLYAIAALAWVDRSNSGHVPYVSVLVVVTLLLTSVGVFIALIKRLGRLEIHRVLGFTGNFGRCVIEAMYPPFTGLRPAAGDDEYRERPVSQAMDYSGPPAVLQSVDVDYLCALAEKSGGVIELMTAVGDTLVERTPVMRIYGGRAAFAERALLRALRTGVDRTFDQDSKYAIRLLVDIAIRALSPAINDPSTAVQALDQIEDLLVRLGSRQIEIGEIRDRSGALRVVIPVPAWEDFLDLALDEIRCCGSGSLQVARRLQALLSDLANAVPLERRHPLRRHRQQLDAAIRRAFPDAGDQRTAAAEDREGFGVTRRPTRPSQQPAA